MAGISATVAGERETVGLINGRKPDSVLEWRFAVGLWAAKWEFLYQEQTPIGGEFITIDFLVLTSKATPVFVDGSYFHGSAGSREKDAYKRALLDSLNKRRWFPHQTVDPNELVDQATANATVVRMFGRGGG